MILNILTKNCHWGSPAEQMTDLMFQSAPAAAAFCFDVFSNQRRKTAEWDLFPLSPSGGSGGGGMQATRDLFWRTRSSRSRFSFTASPVHLQFACTKFKADARTAHARSIHHGTRWDVLPQYFNIGTKQWAACPLNYGIRFLTGPPRERERTTSKCVTWRQ